MAARSVTISEQHGLYRVTTGTGAQFTGPSVSSALIKCTMELDRATESVLAAEHLLTYLLGPKKEEIHA